MKYAVLIICFFIVSLSLTAQEPGTVIRSEKTETIDGKKYYLHEVKQGQTIYSICKAYEVEQSDIALINPEIFEGIKPGQVLKIPMAAGKETTQITIHKVEKGETLYGLSKKFNVTVDQIMEWNPEVKDGLKNGQELKIHSKVKAQKQETVKTQPTDTANPKRPPYHVVKEKETLYGIARLYNMPITDIEQLNPFLTTTGLRNGDTLAITPGGYTPASERPTGPLLFPSQNTTECIARPLGRSAKVALILPFSHDMQILEKEDIKLEKDPNLVPQTKPYLDYYEGFLIALDTLKSQGIQADIYVFDTFRDSSTVAEMVNSGKLTGMDMVIGPVFQKEFTIVADFCQKNNIWCVFPMNTKNTTIDNNPWTIQINPSFETQVKQAVKYMASFSDKNYIVAYSDTTDEKDFVYSYRSLFTAEYNKNFPGKQVPLQDIYLREKGVAGIEKAMKDSCENIVILTTSHQVTVLEMMSRLYAIAKEKPMTLTVMPQWKRFEKNIEFDHLFKMQAVSFDPFFIDQSYSSVIRFNKEFQSRYKNFPGEYSYLGYDSGIYLISLLSKYGKDFVSCMNKHKPALIQSEFYFEKSSPAGGYENSNLFFVKCITGEEDVKSYRVVGQITDTISRKDQ